MKTNLLFFLLFSIFITHGSLVSAQQRGMKPVQLNIEGQATTLYRQSHALLIGVSNYSNGLSSLPGVTSDISAVKASLESNGFNVVTVMNPVSTALQKAFSGFISQYGQEADNRLLFYFAGHGYTEKMPYGEDIGYICPADAPDPNRNPADFHETAMAMGQIEIYAKQIKSKHALFLFDACFAGQIFSTSRAIPEIISYKTREPVRQFITSGSADETVPDKSVFRTQFIRALSGDADGNKDGFITGTELGEYLQTSVVNYSYGSQHPQYGKIRNPNLDRGDFVFVIKTRGTDDLTTTTTPQKPAILEEKSLITSGKLEITSHVAGELYIDNDFMKNLSANTQVTLMLTSGNHKIVVKGDQSYEKYINVLSDKAVSLVIETNQQATPSLHQSQVAANTVNPGYENTRRWSVPEQYKNQKPPVTTLSDNNIFTGKELYAKHCKSCHGSRGLGDGPKAASLKANPGDFSAPSFQDQTDGELIYKINNGRDEMPSYVRKIPDENSRWALLTFIRTFKK